MQYRPLGNTGEKVSAVCLGTMTWGRQNTAEEGMEQMDYAVSRGVNFFDAAELYPIPPEEATYGETERIIGQWFASRAKREEIVLATKVVGRTPMQWFRGENASHSRAHIEQAVEGSLQRLGTDRIDLYQLHWPDRRLQNFGGLGYRHVEDPKALPPAEILAVLADLVKAGKVRWIGLSNETPWGLHAFLKAADEAGMPRMVSVQNAYNLLNRTYEQGMSEFAYREQVGLLAYSPLAQGFLSGKYLDGARPPGARFTLFDRGQRYQTVNANEAVRSYLAVAKKHGMDPAHLANAFVTGQSFVTSSIIGATTMEQLRIAIDGGEMQLAESVLEDIEQEHLKRPNPCP